MRIVKFLAIGIGGLLVVVAGLAAYFAATFDSAQIKSELARIVLEKKQRTLAVNGDLALSFWPNLGVRVEKVTLSEHGSPAEFAAVEKARVSVAVLPLLTKRFVIDTVEIVGAKASIIKRKDGTLNIADLLSPDEKEKSPVQASVAGVTIDDASLTWIDEQSGQRVVIGGLDFSTGAIDVDTGESEYHAEKIRMNAKGTMGDDAFEVRFDAPALAWTLTGASGERLELSAVLTGKAHKASATLTATGLSGSGRAFAVDKLALVANAGAGDSTAALQLGTALAVDLDKHSAALEKISGQIDLADPRMPMKSLKMPLSGRLHANLAKPSAEGVLSTRFDESAIALKFSVDAFSPLTLGFDLDIDQINVDKYLPPEEPSAEKGGDKPIDLSVLKGLRLNGKAKIGKLQAAHVKAENIRLDIRANDGRLEISPHSANLYGGSVTGALSVNADGNVVALRENLSGIDINPLMRDLANRDLIEGQGNVRLDVTTRGTTVGAMKHALDGSAAVALRDGAIKGINLAKTFRDLKSTFTSREDSVQQANSGEKTDFSEMSASFRIAKGVAHNDDLSIKSPFLRISGTGDIDVGDSRLDYLAKASVVASAGGQGGQDLAHLKGVTVPVRASGPFDKLSYRLEFASLAQEAVKARVDEKKQEIRQQAKDKLLKGLLK